MKEIFEKKLHCGKYFPKILQKMISAIQKQISPLSLHLTPDKFSMLHEIKPIPKENNRTKSNKSLSKCFTNGSRKFSIKNEVLPLKICAAMCFTIAPPPLLCRRTDPLSSPFLAIVIGSSFASPNTTALSQNHTT